MRFKSKRVLVTGGNSGIGRGIALAFAKEGAAVAIGGRDREKGAAVLAELNDLGARACFCSGDLSDEQTANQVVQRAVDELGGLEILVNNAGAGSRRGGVEAEDTTGERWAKLGGANLSAPLYTAAAALPHLAASGQGAIVNISSTATWHGNWGLYGVAKAGVEGLTRALAAEGGRQGIRCNGVSPGWIATDQDKAQPASGGADWAMPPSLLNRMGTPAEIAGAVLFLASEEASFVTGQTLIVDGGLMVTDYPSLEMLEAVGHRLKTRPDDTPGD